MFCVMTEIDLILLHAAATWALVGLIWMVQLVQYPGFLFIEGSEFEPFHEHHCSRITWIVAVLMATEAITGAVLLWDRPLGISAGMAWTGASLVIINWLCTGLISAPLHGRLRGSSLELKRRLIWTNWIRTFAWSARGIWAFLLVRSQIPG